MLYLISLGILIPLGLGILYLQLRSRSLDRWLFSYLFAWGRYRSPQAGEEIRLILCLADHYEPKESRATAEVSWARVQRWQRDYPLRIGHFRDSDGRPPRHSFFFPIEEYEAEYLDALGELCQAGYGEVEIHLHHDHDTSAGVREKLLRFKELLAERHGMLSRHRETGELAYGFIHGNWALDNSRPDGRWCGVNNELDILRETGCYADFTLPSAPSPTQTRKINSIYFACDDPLRPKSHDTGVNVGSCEQPANSLMLIQGPLLLDWQNRKWGLLPRLENACLQASQPPSIRRLTLWLKARIQVPSRPEWYFVKLHTHGATTSNADALLGEPMVRFHESLAEEARKNPRFHYHYVTAREMYNLVRAAEAGWRGSVADARDYELIYNSCTPALIPAEANTCSS